MEDGRVEAPSSLCGVILECSRVLRELGPAVISRPLILIGYLHYSFILVSDYPISFSAAIPKCFGSRCGNIHRSTEREGMLSGEMELDAEYDLSPRQLRLT